MIEEIWEMQGEKKRMQWRNDKSIKKSYEIFINEQGNEFYNLLYPQN